MTNIRNIVSLSSPLHPANVVPLAARVPERLVGIGFRSWLTGFSTSDVHCWENAWNAFSSTLGNDRAKTLLIELSQFVRAVKVSTHREIEVQAAGCRGFCRDECLAISIIAACQHDARSALTASAAALIGSDDIGDTLAGAQTFACGLSAANQLLSADSVCPATCALRVGRSRLM